MDVMDFILLIIIPSIVIIGAIISFWIVKKSRTIENRIVCWQCYNLFIRNNPELKKYKSISDFFKCTDGSKFISSLHDITNLKPSDIEKYIKLMIDDKAERSLTQFLFYSNKVIYMLCAALAIYIILFINFWLGSSLDIFIQSVLQYVGFNIKFTSIDIIIILAKFYFTPAAIVLLSTCFYKLCSWINKKFRNSQESR